MKRVLLALVCIVFAAAVLAPMAGADPAKAKNSTLIQANCPSGSVTVSVNGNGEFTPAHDIASTSVFVPTAFDTTFTFTPASGPVDIEHDTSAKSAPIKNTATCTIPLQTLFSGPEGTATIQGTVTGFWTPRG